MSAAEVVAPDDDLVLWMTTGALERIWDGHQTGASSYQVANGKFDGFINPLVLKSTLDASRAETAAANARAEAAKAEGVDFVFDALAKAFGLESWTPHDGSEMWDGDVRATLMGILRDSGAIDPETDEPASVRAEEIQELADGLEKFGDEQFARAEALEAQMALIADIAEGSTTANSLQHIAKIARGRTEIEGKSK